MIIIAVDDKAWKDVCNLRQKTKDIAKKVLQMHKYIKYELEIIYSNDQLLQQLNNNYRGKNKPTNVLSFPYINHSVFIEVDILGEIFISFEQIQKEALGKGITFDNHLAHILTHGILHLIGYTHNRKKDAAIMEGKERDILQTMGIGDPYVI